MRPVAAVLLFGLLCSGAITTAAAPGKDYHGQDLRNKDFSRAALDGANFSGATIQGVSFQSADLTGADLRGTVGEANYSAANLTHANLEGLTFKGFALGDCKCRGANFRKTKIATSVYRCDFREADFRGANLRAAAIDTRGVIQWKGAIYDDDTAFPDGFDPKAAGLVPAKAVGEAGDKKEPTAAAPAGKDFHGQDLKNKDFSLGSLNGANFSDATLTGANFSKASLKRANFNGANLQGASFQSADLSEADLRGIAGEANYEAANLTNANLEALTFQGFALGDCKCRGANFRKAKIATSVYRSDFREADFRGANLRAATIDTRGIVQWKGAIYDDNTAFPDGFDPKAVAMVVGKIVADEPPRVVPAPPPPRTANPAQAPANPSAPVPTSPANSAQPSATPLPPVPAPSAPVVAVPDRAPQPAPPALAAEKGDLQLSGLYLSISSLAMGGRLQFSYYHYYFLPDGHVFYGIPPGGTVKQKPTAEDIAALMKASAKSLGIYKVTGDQLTIQYPGGKPRTDKSSIQKNGDLGTIVVNGAWAVRKGQFNDNQTLHARYATTSTIKSGGDESHGGGDRINVSSLNALDFQADGTFTGAGAVDLGVTSKTSNTGSSSRSADHGKYKISGNTLTMTHADGKTELLTAYPIPDKDESPPKHLNINGVIYNLEK